MVNHVFVIGSATWDVLFTTPEAKLLSAARRRRRFLAFPYGGKLDAKDVTYGFGGGAANVSVGLTRLGLSATIITRLGRDWRGDEVVKNLRLKGVVTNRLQRDSAETTPLSFVVTTGGPRDHVAFVARGAAKNLKIPSSLPVPGSWFYVTSLASPRWSSQLLALFKSAKENKQSVFWNPGTKQLEDSRAMRRLLPYVTILDLNHAEAEFLARDLKLRDGTTAGLLEALHRSGAKNVLMTEGAKGAHFYDGWQVYYHHSLEVELVNTTGAGDGFGSGWLAGYVSSGGRIEQAMRWGMLNSSSVILQVGAQRGLLTLPQLKSFERQYVKARGYD
ncbi:MAG: carbohydrate kinase family protein [Candidatus Kerfeldbacteria bacterium]|nr:carbohydrate kinase family protein [Candidatus Kerfeldbacteria bacterium]